MTLWSRGRRRANYFYVHLCRTDLTTGVTCAVDFSLQSRGLGSLSVNECVPWRSQWQQPRMSRTVFLRQGAILPARKMGSLFSSEPQEFIDSVGASLNVGVNERADVLHTLLVNVMEEDV